VISQQPFDRFWWNLVRRCILGHPIWRSTKNFKISKSKMADGGHLENKKSWYLRNPWPILTKFCMMAHISPPELISWSKLPTFKNPRWQTSSVLKIVECDISATVWPILVKFGMAMHIRLLNMKVNQKFQNFKIQDGRLRISPKPSS